MSQVNTEPRHARAKLQHFSDDIFIAPDNNLVVEGLGICRKLCSDTAKLVLERNGIKTDLVGTMEQDANSQLVYLTKCVPLVILPYHNGSFFSDYDIEEVSQIITEKPLNGNIGDVFMRMYRIATRSFDVLNHYMRTLQTTMTLQATSMSFGVTLDGDVVVTSILDPIESVWTLSDTTVFPLGEMQRAVEESDYEKIGLFFECFLMEFTKLFSQTSSHDLINMIL